jgi:hypothetical protein
MQTMDELSDAVCASEGFCDDKVFKALHPRLQLTVRRLLEKERAKRPASAKIVAKVLRDLGGI